MTTEPMTTDDVQSPEFPSMAEKLHSEVLARLKYQREEIKAILKQPITVEVRHHCMGIAAGIGAIDLAVELLAERTEVMKADVSLSPVKKREIRGRLADIVRLATIASDEISGGHLRGVAADCDRIVTIVRIVRDSLGIKEEP